MAFQTFMKIDGISGESSDSTYKGWIEVLGMKWGLTNPKDAEKTGLSARTRVSDFTIFKSVDVSSPLLFNYASMAKIIPKIKIEVCRAGAGDKVKYIEYTFTNCVITEIRLNAGVASKAEETLPLEELAFDFEKVELTYTQQKRADGIGGGVTQASYDRRAK